MGWTVAVGELPCPPAVLITSSAVEAAFAARHGIEILGPPGTLPE